MPKPIGGYFGWETEVNPEHRSSLRDDGCTLNFNSARSALSFLLGLLKPKRVWVPSFYCGAILSVLRDIELVFYGVDASFEIASEILWEQEDLLLCVNFFGIKNRYVSSLEEQFLTRTVVDDAHAYYRQPQRRLSFAISSTRKFFGVPDGGHLHFPSGRYVPDLQLPSNDSVDCSHLYFASHLQPELGLEKFRQNERECGAEIRAVSTLTRRIMQSIVHQRVIEKRWQNFRELHAELAGVNELDITFDQLDLSSAPYCYPLVLPAGLDLHQALWDQRIYVPRLWSNLAKDEAAHMPFAEITDRLLPLPVDQRYGVGDMRRIMMNINQLLDR